MTKLTFLSEKETEALWGGRFDRIINIVPQANLGAAVASRGGRARLNQDNSSFALNLIA
ncbi:MAG: hypothetical protein RLZZ516_1955 [Cyanobacteriota bacterium]|jgi:hypothetical protein